MSLVKRNIIEIVISLLIFLISIYIVKWYAKKKDMISPKVEVKYPTRKLFNTYLISSIIISLIWLIIDIPIGILFNFLFIENIVFDIINVLIDICIGTFIVKIIYDKNFKDSLLFVLVIQVILFVIAFVLSLLISLLLSFISVGLHEIVLYILVTGLPLTLLMTFVGLISGFALGITLAIMRVYGGKELGWFSSGYEKLFRSIPLLVLIFIFAFGIPELFWFIEDPLLRPFAGVLLALTLRSAAYQSQIFRGAILSVNPNQMEAARALGMNRMQAFRHVVMPQALRLAVPSWSNEYAVVIKDSSFAYAVGIIEMTRAAYYVSINIPEFWAVSMAIVTVLYFLFTFPVTKLFGERQSKKLKELGMGGG